MIKIDEIKTLYIGKQGENSANIAVFDLTDWVEEYGAGTAKLLHQRNGDEIPYIAQTTQSGSTLSWIFTSDDTAFNGYGKAQLNYYVDDVLAKTLIFTTKCDKSLTDETEAPGEVKSALDLIAGTVDGKLSPSNIKAGQNVTVDIDGNDVTINASGGGGGTSDYSQLANKPSINSVELNGNKSLADLGIQPSGSYATSSDFTAEATARQNADNNLQGQIDAITVSSDVIDVVGTYADLQNYDTSHVKANDIIKVLQDSTHNDALSYYRWVITDNVGAWVYVGSEGPFYTKSETETILDDYATITALNSGLATKQNAFNVGKGLTLANSVLSADTNKQLFVGSLPTENISENAIYYTPNYALFSGVANYITTDYPTVVVTRQNDLPSKMLQMACNTNKNYSVSSPKSYIYNIYDYVDGKWVLNQSSSVSEADNQWATKLGLPTNVTGSAATVRAQFEALIWYSSQDFSYERSYWGYKTVKSSETPPVWRGNVTDANGVPLDTSSINYCLFNTYQYVNGAWVNYGVSDFSELFTHFIDVLNSKADSVTTYTKTEVDNLISTAIADVSSLIGGAS